MVREGREWIAFIAVWLAIAGLLAADLWADRRLLLEGERARLTQQAKVLNDNIAQQLQAIDYALLNLSSQLLQRHPPKTQTSSEGWEPSERLNALGNIMVGVNTMLFIDAQGIVLASDRANLVGSDFSQRPYFQTARELPEAGTLIVGPPLEPVADLWVMTLAHVVSEADGRFGGVLAAALDAESFRTLLQSVRYAPDMKVELIHGDGLRFIAQSGALTPSGVDVSQPFGPLAYHLASGQPASVFWGPESEDGLQRLVALQSVQPPKLSMNKPLVVSVGRSWQAIIGPWQFKVWTVAGTLGMAMLISAVALWVWQQRRRDLELHQRTIDERWRRVLQATQQGAWDWNLRTGGVYLSPVWKAMLGYAEHEVGDSFQEWQSYVHPDDLPSVRADLQRHLDGKTPYYENMHRLRRKDGSYQWTQGRGSVIERDDKGRPLHVIGTQFDMTERYELQQLLDRLVSNVPGAIYQYQIEHDGRSHFPYVSPRLEELYECSGSQLHLDAECALQRIHPEDMQGVRESMEQAAYRLQVWKQEYRLVQPHRGERWVSDQAMPERLASGAVLWHGYVHDITEAKQQELQLQETQRVLQYLMNEMPIGLCMVDSQHRIYFRNRRFMQDFGFQAAGQKPGDILSMHDWSHHAYPDPAYRAQVGQVWKAAMAQALNGDGQIPERDYRITACDGSLRSVAIRGLVFGDHFFATFIDRTEQQAKNEALRKLAYIDGLTGVANRRHFDQALQAEWRRCRRSQKPLSLVLLDIDHFKQYNDLYGHQQGDACLRTVATALRSNLARSYDLVARYGGEEFVCLLPECDLEGATKKAQALCDAVRAMGISHAGSSAANVVTISLGVSSQVPDAEGKPEVLLARADAMLYRAKEKGRNRVEACHDNDSVVLTANIPCCPQDDCCYGDALDSGIGSGIGSDFLPLL